MRGNWTDPCPHSTTDRICPSISRHAQVSRQWRLCTIPELNWRCGPFTLESMQVRHGEFPPLGASCIASYTLRRCLHKRHLRKDLHAAVLILNQFHGRHLYFSADFDAIFCVLCRNWQLHQADHARTSPQRDHGDPGDDRQLHTTEAAWY